MRATNNKGLQAALDWIEENPNGDLLDFADSKQETTEDGKGKEIDDDIVEPVLESSEQVPEGFKKAFKCNACDCTLASVELAQLHASKTGHDDFSETVAKKLTEEEKKLKLEELKAKLEEKRAQQAEAEKQRQLENEKIRRKAGKEAEELKREREKKEYEKLRAAQQREQQEAKAAKDRILAMIEEDKKERARKFGGGLAVEKSPELAPIQPPTPTDSARIQLRLPDGRSKKYTLEAKATFKDLVNLIHTDCQEALVPNVFFILQPGNQRLKESDADKTLESLGMSPSATILLSHGN